MLAPRYWGVHLLALAALAVAVSLGLWQYDAFQAHRAEEARDLTLGEPRPLTEVMGPDDPFPARSVGQPVVVAGSWVPDGTVFVSGREDAGRDGFWVATPVAVDQPAAAAEDAPALYVVRGWTEDPDAAPPAPTGEVELVGWLQPTEGTGEMDADRSDDVLPQLRTADLVQHVDQDLYGAYAVVADRVAPGDWPVGPDAVNPGSAGLEPAALEQLPEVPGSTGLRNLLYAIEWWVFGVFAGYIWWRYVRDVTEQRAAAQAVARSTDDHPVPSGS